MDQLFFTISFVYEILRGTLQVDLCADIELIGDDTCFVHNIQRIDMQESSLLPVIKLVLVDGRWVHSESNKESNISRAVGEGIERHIRQLSKRPNKLKGI